MDLMKLHPAPWRVVDDLDDSFFVLDAKGQVIPWSRELAKKTVLAINAEKVIMDVGIFPVPVKTGFSTWCLHPNRTVMSVYSACGEGCSAPPLPHAGPFEAIEEAMKWLTKNKKIQTKQSDSASAP